MSQFDPKSDKFVVLPWDLDHSLGGFFLVGSADQLADLSIRQPHTGRNRLIERLLADDKVFARYKAHLAEVTAKAFTVGRIEADLAAVSKVVAPVRERERAAAKERKEPPAMTFGPPGARPSTASRLASATWRPCASTPSTPPGSRRTCW